MHYLSPEETFQYMSGLPKGDIFEFGVYNGNYLRRLIKGAIEQGNPFESVWGFDSWQGLPEEAEGLWLNPDWPKSAFSIYKDYDLKTDDDCVRFVCQRIDLFLGNLPKPPLNFVSGFFTESLNRKLGKDLTNKASYIHVDVDLYISSAQCLDWIFEYGIAKEGCLFRFDDWGSTPLWSAGNSRAFMEVTNQYELVWSQLGNNVYIYEGKSESANSN